MDPSELEEQTDGSFGHEVSKMYAMNNLYPELCGPVVEDAEGGR